MLSKIRAGRLSYLPMEDPNHDRDDGSGDDGWSETPTSRIAVGSQGKPLGHELRVQALALVAEREQLSPVVAAKELDAPLGNVAYHFRELADRGLIREVGSRQRRGATEHFYGINPGYPDWPEILADIETRMRGLSALQALAKTLAGFTR